MILYNWSWDYHNHRVKMGCTVSLNEIAKVGYTPEFIQDLLDRNHSQPMPYTQYQSLPERISYIYGYTQSYTNSFLFNWQYGDTESHIYTAGRFVVLDSAKGQKLLPHKEKVGPIDLHEKLLAVGCNGGQLLVWSLEFMEVKVNIKLSSAISFSSLSLTEKHIFATDTTRPFNRIYCFDVKRALLQASSPVSSQEPTLKGISLSGSLHITIASDGLWFYFYSSESNRFTIEKGLIEKNLQTSMTCLDKVNKTHVVSGGIDGNIFIWDINGHQCTKVLRVAEAPLTALRIGGLGKNLVVCSLNRQVKCYNFEVFKKKSPLGDQKLIDEINSVLIDTYSKEAPIQVVAFSSLSKHVYYCQTRAGHMFSHIVPELINVQHSLAQENSLIYFDSCGHCQLINSNILNVSTIEQDSSLMSLLRYSGGKIYLKQQRSIRTPGRIIDFPEALCSHLNHLAFMTTKGLVISRPNIKSLDNEEQSVVWACSEISAEQVEAMQYITFQQSAEKLIQQNQDNQEKRPQKESNKFLGHPSNQQGIKQQSQNSHYGQEKDRQGSANNNEQDRIQKKEQGKNQGIIKKREYGKILNIESGRVLGKQNHLKMKEEGKQEENNDSNMLSANEIQNKFRQDKGQKIQQQQNKGIRRQKGKERQKDEEKEGKKMKVQQKTVQNGHRVYLIVTAKQKVYALKAKHQGYSFSSVKASPSQGKPSKLLLNGSDEAIWDDKIKGWLRENQQNVSKEQLNLVHCSKVGVWRSDERISVGAQVILWKQMPK